MGAFVAFAETGGVVPAAEVLNVSNAAISQRSHALAAHLDMPLLDLTRRSLTLTAEEESVAKALSLGFGAIRAAVQELVPTKDNRPVHITCTPTFAAHWLMPRLADFDDGHPEIDLAIDSCGEVVELRSGGINIVLRFGRGN